MGFAYSYYDGIDKDVLNWMNTVTGGTSSGLFIYNLSVMVKQLKANGTWNLLDRFFLFATEFQDQARVCLKSLKRLSEVNSPNWIANQGYSGNGTTAYLNSNYTMSTQGVNYTLNNCSMGVYSRTNIAGSYVDMGSYDAGGARRAYLYIRRSDLVDKSVSAFNTLTDNSASAPTVTDSRGLFSLVRTISTAYATYKNGTSIGGSTLTANALTTNSNFILGLNTSVATLSTPSVRQISMAYFGSGNINQLNFYNVFQSFATKQGFNV